MADNYGGYSNNYEDPFRGHRGGIDETLQRRRTRLMMDALRDGDDTEVRSFNSGQNNNYDEGDRLVVPPLEKSLFDKICTFSPIIGALRTYNRQDLIKDFLAGMTISLVLIPQGIGFAILADIPVYHGILSGIFPVFIYAFLGGGKHLSVGPEAATTVVLAETIRLVREEHPEVRNVETYQIAALITLMVGLINIIFAGLRLGFLNNLLTGSLLIGFVGALGFLIMAEQLAPLFGVIKPEPEFSTMQKLWHVFEHIGQTHVPTMIVGVVGIIFLLTMQTLKQKIKHPVIQNLPTVLVLVAVMISASAAIGFEGRGVAVLGKIDLKFQPPRLPKVPTSIIPTLIQPAITMAVVGFIETMVAANAFANKHDYQVNGNRELAALGASNLFGGLLGSYTIIASFARSKIYEAAGARTMVGGLFTGSFVLGIYLLLLPVLKFLPRATVGSILFVAGFNLIEVFEIGFTFRMGNIRDICFLAIAFGVSACVNTEVGLMVCILLSLMTLLKKSSKPEMTVLGEINEGGELVYRSIEEFPYAKTDDEIMVIRVLSSLRFYNSNLVRDRIARLEKRLRKLAQSYGKGPAAIQEIVLDIGLCKEIDSTGALVLYELIHSLHHRHVQLTFANVKPHHRNAFKSAKIIEEIGEKHLYETLVAAVEGARSRLNRGHSHGSETKGPFDDDYKIDMAFPPQAALMSSSVATLER